MTNKTNSSSWITEVKTSHFQQSCEADPWIHCCLKYLYGMNFLQRIMYY